jgi:hypothetical protein
MAEYLGELYQYETLPTHTSFRVFELLPGVDGDPISCVLRDVDRADSPKYEAVSYAWGDPVNVDGNWQHLRYQDRSRVLWADAIW